MYCTISTVVVAFEINYLISYLKKEYRTRNRDVIDSTLSRPLQATLTTLLTYCVLRRELRYNSTTVHGSGQLSLLLSTRREMSSSSPIVGYGAKPNVADWGRWYVC